MTKGVKIELQKPVRCKECHNILRREGKIIWEGDIAGRSITFYDKYMIKNLSKLFHCREQTELGYDTKELSSLELNHIYRLAKYAPVSISENFEVLQDIAKDLGSIAETRAVITFEKVADFRNDDSKNVNILTSMLTLIICLLPFILSLCKMYSSTTNIMSTILFWASIAVVVEIIITFSLLLSLLKNENKSKTLVFLSSTAPISCKNCGTLSETTHFIDFVGVIVDTRAFKKSGLSKEDTLLSIDDLIRLHKKVKRYDPPYTENGQFALFKIDEFINTMKLNNTVKVKMDYIGELGHEKSEDDTI